MVIVLLNGGAPRIYRNGNLSAIFAPLPLIFLCVVVVRLQYMGIIKSVFLAKNLNSWWKRL